ncbi:MAG: hypothetical protein HeimC2_44700 [Candidatus Heimdallarchaeota archaeon LC_2]|nr:MAG: hypothetical protein HeimC2_44700 [Candidatus Heimdallarchaeota archaeon LC_2]
MCMLVNESIKYATIGILISIIISSAVFLSYNNLLKENDQSENNSRNQISIPVFNWDFSSALALSSQMSARTADLRETQISSGSFSSSVDGFSISSEQLTDFYPTSSGGAFYSSLWSLKRYDNAVKDTYITSFRVTGTEFETSQSQDRQDFNGYISNRDLIQLQNAFFNDLAFILDFQEQNKSSEFQDIFFAGIPDGTPVIVIEHLFDDGSFFRLTFADLNSVTTLSNVNILLMYALSDRFYFEWNERDEPGAGEIDFIQESVKFFYGFSSNKMDQYLNNFPNVLEEIYLNYFSGG